MKKIMLVCLAAALASLAILSSPGGAPADPSKSDTIPFGTLVRGASCPAATHTVLSPCFPFPPTSFAVFQKNKDVTQFEGRNVTMRGVIDLTSCPLPLMRVTKIDLSTVLPPCPPPQCNPGDPPPCP